MIEVITAPMSSIPARQPGAMLTVVGQAVHVSPDADKPTVAEIAFERPLLTAQQPYIRWLHIGEQWQRLDFGWLAEEGASYLVLANDPPAFATNPTTEERAAALAKVVEVAFLPPLPADAGTRTMFSPSLPARTPFAALDVPPGEQQPLTPAAGVEIQVRCRSGSTRCTLTVFPR